MEDYKLIAISEEEYRELLNDRRELHALESAGVDNWEGYEDAMRTLDEL